MTWSESDRLKAAVKEHGMELLALHQTAEWNGLDRFAVQKNIMAFVATTLIAAAAVAVASNSEAIVYAAMLAPLAVTALRQYAIEVLDRYHARFLQAAGAQQKLRFMLGVGSGDDVPFEEDEFLEVARSKDNEVGSGSTLWVREGLGGGHNDVVWRMFRGLCWASAILPVFAAARLLTWTGAVAANSMLTSPAFIGVAVAASWVALGLAYAAGTDQITKERDEAYGRLPDKAPQTDGAPAGSP